jgi:hypothetical protein
MDGLSLLGLVASQRLGEGGDGRQAEVVVRPEDVKVELQEEEPCNGGLLGEFESSTSNICVKGENAGAVRGLEHQWWSTSGDHLMLTNQHYEKSSQGVATHLNVSDFGQFQYKIMENQLCKYSKFTGWHLQRSTGMMKIKLSFRGLRIKGPMLVRALLVRKDETYRHFGVDRVCENHQKEVPWEGREQVLQAAPGLEGMWQYGGGGPRRSLCFMVGSPHPETGALEETIGLKCICNDSCSTCDDQTFKQTESSRDLLLVLTLESVDYRMILARRSIGVWPKAVVRPKELNKPERRKPKGGAAKLNKPRELQEQERAGWPAPASGANGGCLGPRARMDVAARPRADLGSGVFKIAPKIPVISSGPGRQTFNILLPVESRGGIPTTLELMDTTIGLAIKNARTLGIGNEEFVKRVQERLQAIPGPCPPQTPARVEEEEVNLKEVKVEVEAGAAVATAADASSG